MGGFAGEKDGPRGGGELGTGGSLAEAEALQRELAARVVLSPLSREPVTVAGLDAAYVAARICAAAVLYRRQPLQELEARVVVRECTVSYLPGYFHFREGTALIEALGALSERPELLLVEGHGIAHPRRCGIASHIGVLTGIPAVGCAKTRLIGDYREPGADRGAWSPLYLEGVPVGAVLRTRSGVKPVFVSPGHLVTLEEAISIVLECTPAFRTPEPLRGADREAQRGLLLR